MATDPNMGFTNPTPGVTTGGSPSYTYANNISSALTTIGAHNHTPGGSNGVQVPTAGLNINADLTFNGNSATDVNNVDANLVNSLGYTGYFSIYQYGATGNGTTDDSGAFTSAFSAMSSGGILVLPQGTFRISNDVVVPTGVALQFFNSTIKIDNGHALKLHSAGSIIAPPVQIFQFTASPSVTPVQWGTWGTSGSPTSLGLPPIFYPQWWGAKGDGTTNDQPAFQQAINSCGTNANPVVTLVHGTGGTMLVPAGHYILGDQLYFGAGSSAIRMTGTGITTSGYQGTLLHFTNASGHRCVTIGGEPISGGGYEETDNIEIDHLMIWQDTTAGAALSIGTVGPAARWNIHDIELLCYNITSSTAYGIELDAGQASGEAEFGIFNNILFSTLDGWTAVPIYMTGTATGVGGQCDGIVFDNIWWNGGLTGTVPFCEISAESTSGTGVQGCEFRNIRLEAPVAGGWLIKGAPGIVIRTVIAGDNGSTPLTTNFIKIQTGAGSVNLPNRILLENVWCDSSVGTTSIPTLYFADDTSNQTSLVCINCQFPWVKIDTGSTANIINIGSVFGGLSSGSKVPLQMNTDGITGLVSLSGTGTLARNLRGQLTITSGNPSGSVSFANSESDTSYYLSLTPVAGNSGGNIIQSVSKNTGGFTVTLTANAGATITYDWHLIR